MTTVLCRLDRPGTKSPHGQKSVVPVSFRKLRGKPYYCGFPLQFRKGSTSKDDPKHLLAVFIFPYRL